MDPGILEADETEALSLKTIVNRVLVRREINPDMKVFVRGDLASEYDAMIQLIGAIGHFSIKTAILNPDFKWVDELGIMVENVNL